MGERVRLTICHDCAVPHADNCPECFGFGRYADGGIVTAAAAIEGPLRGAVVPCQVCGGTEKGTPSGAIIAVKP